MGRFTGKSCKMSTMFLLTLGFFLVEVIFGYLTRSMALIADSFHMLSDLLAMVVAFACMRISKRRNSSRNTFGWVRAEVLGALINTVFLVALAFSIVLESIKRFFEPETLEDPKKVLIVGALGLGVNIIGLFLFHGHGGHGHSHGGSTGGGHGHGHSHSDKKSSKVAGKNREEHGHSPTPSTDSQLQHRHTSYCPHQDNGDDDEDETNGHQHIREPDQILDRNTAEAVRRIRKRSSKYAIRSEELAEYATTPEARQDPKDTAGRPNDAVQNEDPSTINKESKKKSGKKTGGAAQQMNMRGVWLHVMGDAFGSVVVIINAVVNMTVKNYFLNHYLDPMLSLIMALIIIGTSAPLLKDSALILLQTVPKDINVQDIKKRLLEQFGQMIADIHEFHVWCLSGNKIVATAHVRFNGDMDDYMRLAEKMKEFFHDEGMHSTTIQPELVPRGGRIEPGAKYCALKCPKKSTGERQCAEEEVCCVVPPSPGLEVVTTRTNSQSVSPSSSIRGTKQTSTGQFSFSENQSYIDEKEEGLHM